MQLDQTSIVIRERGLLDQMDLALLVLRRYIGPLSLAWVVSVLPLALLNYWLLSRMLQESQLLVDLSMDYLYYLTILMIWQVPLATSLITLCLGKALFLQPLTAGGIFRQLLSNWRQILLIQILLRGALAVWLVMLATNYADEAVLVLLSLLLWIGWTVPHLGMPYLNEILLLEGNRLWSSQLSSQHMRVGTLRRASSLHLASGAGMIGRWVVLSILGALMVLVFWNTLEVMYGLLMIGPDEGSQLLLSVFYPLAVWIVVGYLAVVRFLGYIDLRIRTEGWEVELQLRAEGARLERQVAQ